MTGPEDADLSQKKRRIAAVFDRAAPLYDQVGPRFFTHFGQRLVELAQIKRAAKVLDVACGRGAVLFPAARAVSPSGKVIGVDLSETMLHETRRELRRMKVVNASLQHMDAEHLRFEDRTFDYVLCGLGLLFFPQAQQALAEMYRVLRPLGRIAISTWDKQGDDYWHWFEQDLYKAHMPPDEEIIPPPEPQPPSVELDTPEGLKEAMRTAGFDDIQVIAESIDLTYQDEQEWWDALWTNSMRNMLEEIEQATGPDGLEKFKQAAFEHLRALPHQDGIHQWWPILFAVGNKPQD